MDRLRQILRILIFALPVGSSSVQAALVNFTLIGNLVSADAGNDFGLSLSDSITVSGIFDDNGLTGVGSESIVFSASSGNNLGIAAGVMNFTQMDDVNYSLGSSPRLSFLDGSFNGFTFSTEFGTLGYFTSVGLSFDSGDDNFNQNYVTGTWGSYSVSAANYRQAADSALIWLKLQQKIDGHWGIDIETAPLSTSASVVALRAHNDLSSSYFEGLTWLENHAAPSTDYKARRILALVPHEDNIQRDLNYLLSSQQTGVTGNRGWGVTSLYDGAPIDSALVLQAYSSLGITTNVQEVLDYLKATQLGGTDNGWSLGLETTSEPVITAHVVRALIKYNGFDPSLNAPISNAISTLISSVNSNSPALVKAHTALTLLKNDSSSSEAVILLNSLVNTQLGNGSWDNDAYITGIVLQAFAAAMGSDLSSMGNTAFIPATELRSSINTVLNKNQMDVLTVGEMKDVTALSLAGLGITDITGLELTENLTYLDISNNQIQDLSPLAGLTNLSQVFLDGNPLSDAFDVDGDGFSDLSELTNGSDPLAFNYADGDINEDGVVNAADLILAHRMVVGLMTPTTVQLSHADVAPLVGGNPQPNGSFNLGDLIVIQRKALGQINF